VGHLNREAPLLLLSLLSRHGQGEQQARARKTPGRAQPSPPGHRLVEVAYGPLLNVAGGMRRARCAEMVAGQLKAPLQSGPMVRPNACTAPKATIDQSYGTGAEKRVSAGLLGKNA
jgi:hypothetical protein